MSLTFATSNKATVLDAFDTLFNKRDYKEAERFWSPDYIQHSAHIAPGREGLLALTSALPETLRYENDFAVAEGDLVILHGRFSGHGLPRNWIVADIVRLEMYGPPRECKGKRRAIDRSAQMYSSIRAKMLSRTKIPCPLLGATLGVRA